MALNTEIITDVQVASLAINDVAFDEAYFTNYKRFNRIKL